MRESRKGDENDNQEREREREKCGVVCIHGGESCIEEYLVFKKQLFHIHWKRESERKKEKKNQTASKGKIILDKDFY
uniref:Uncharacterized protein n=1 Tax=Octopus bimaculoides TaxID=37653 RepID=A0A0L8FL95_OCTBM